MCLSIFCAVRQPFALSEDGLRAACYSAGRPELSAVKVELEAGKDVARLRLYERAVGRYAPVVRVDLMIGEETLRAGDYVGDGFAYLNVDVPVYIDVQTQSLTARLSASFCTDGKVNVCVAGVEPYAR